MRIRSVGSKLTLWYTSLFTLTFLLLGGIAYGLLTYSLSRDLDYALNGVAGVLAQKARVEGPSLYPPEVDDIFRRFLGFSPLDRYFDLLDPRGRRDPGRSASPPSEISISPQALENASRGIPTFETIASSGDYPVRVLTQPVMDAGRVVKLVQVGMPLENMIKTRRRFLLTMASVLPLVLILAGGGGWLLARRALKPVDTMTRTAQRIGAEHIDARLHETGNGDELDRLANTLNDMLGRLDAAFHQMRQFSADASHELQTPLTILKGEMEVALRHPRSPEEYQQVLRSGLEEIERIHHLVAGLLMLARADAGVLRLESGPVELEEIFKEVVRLMTGVAEAHSIALQARLPEPVCVPGDREHLRRLLLNLVDNAIKYTPEGGQVALSLRSDGQWASMTVADTGVGIPRDEQRLIFDRFHRSTRTRSRDAGGVGLGLSIARSIVDAHGGRIEVESAPGQGSVFRVLLPLHRDG